MENKIYFNPKWLKAAATIAARNDIRYYLNGVFVEVYASEARLVATDGHRMVIFRKMIEGCAPGHFIIPTQIIDMLKLDSKSKLDVSLEYNPENAADKVTLDYKGVAIQFAPIDGKYPSYDQVMNKAAKPSGESADFNPVFLANISRCVEIAFGKERIWAPKFWQNGNEPAGVTYKGHEDFFGIVMPMRAHGESHPPKWTMPAPEEQRQPEEALAA